MELVGAEGGGGTGLEGAGEDGRRGGPEGGADAGKAGLFEAEGVLGGEATGIAAQEAGVARAARTPARPGRRGAAWRRAWVSRSMARKEGGRGRGGAGRDRGGEGGEGGGPGSAGGGPSDGCGDDDDGNAEMAAQGPADVEVAATHTAVGAASDGNAWSGAAPAACLVKIRGADRPSRVRSMLTRPAGRGRRA